MDIELKNAIEASNKLVEEIRSEQKADAEKMARMEKGLADLLSEKSALETRLADVETKAARPGVAGGEVVDEHKSAFINFLRKSQDGSARAALEAKAASVNATGPDNAGFAVPKVIASTVLTQLTDISPVRQVATVISVESPDYVEILDKNNGGSEWVGEMSERGTTAAPDLAQIRPAFGTIHATVEVSAQALQDFAFDVEAWLTAALAEKFAQKEGQAFVAGDGVNKPRGFLHGNALTVVNSGSAADLGANPHDGIVNLLYGVKAGYRANASFAMNSNTLASLVKVKNANGDYIYTPALAEGMSDRILGKRLVVAEDMPGVAAGSTPIAVGDFAKGYLIADRVGMSILVDPFTKPGFIKFIAAKRVGGTVRDDAALKLLKVSA